ncbi:MAG: hypothetical protein EB021_05820 [Gammaproteobacteria bacterium]|nr:hypothetical protein [Gammaproteobacteria bacterium]
MLASALPSVATTPRATTVVAETLRQRIEAIDAGTELGIEGERLQARRSLAKLYALNEYRPYWDATRLQSLLEVLEDVADDGLRPADYHFETLRRLSGQSPRTALDQVQLDLLASDAFALVLYHLYFGKVDPVSLDANWNFDARVIRETDAVRFVHEAIRGIHPMIGSCERRTRRLADDSRRTRLAMRYERPARGAAASTPRDVG